MRLISLLLFTALTSFPAFSQLASRGAAPDRKEVRIRRVISDADGLPFEFKADIQLNALELNSVSPDLARGVLRSLFLDAGGAQYRFRQRDVASPPGFATHAWHIAQAQGLQLDTMSVRARAIGLMAGIDPARAWLLLKDAGVRPPAVSCTSTMVDDPSGYYGTLSSVLPVVWTKAKIPEGERYLFIEQRLEEISSPVQLALMARLLARLGAMSPKPLSAALLNQLEDMFAGVLSRTTGSDRELSAEAGNVTESVEEFLSGSIDPVRARLLISSLGDFWRANGKERRCPDRPRGRDHAVEEFNSLAAKYFPGDSSQSLRLGAEDRSPTADGPSTEFIPNIYDTTLGDLMRSLHAYQETSLAAPEQQSEEARRGAEENISQALQLFDTITTPTAGCSACVFQEKRLAIFFLFDLAPSEDSKEKALEALVRLLASDQIQEQSRIEWLWHVHFLLNLARTPNKEQSDEIGKFTAGKESYFQFLPKQGDELILDTMVRSGNPILMQYANAERILGSKYELPPTLRSVRIAQAPRTDMRPLVASSPTDR